MKFRLVFNSLLLAPLLLGISLPLAAEFRTIAIAHEVSLPNFRAPTTPNANVIFRICDTCEDLSSRATANTRYFVNDRSVTLKEFREGILDVQDRANSTIIVKQHLDSNTVVYVSVTD